MVDNGAFISLVCYNALTEEAKKHINKNNKQMINGPNGTPEETTGKLPI